MTRDGVAYLLGAFTKAARQRHHLPCLICASITHIRHSCAVALLEAGIELTAIRDYLGHHPSPPRVVTPDESGDEARCAQPFLESRGFGAKPAGRWRPAKLICFLESL
jgi:hypothetical protein